MQSTNTDARQAATQARNEFGVKVSSSVIRKHASRGRVKVRPVGRPPFIPADVEEGILQCCALLRIEYFPLTDRAFQGLLMKAVKGSVYEKYFKDGVQRGWMRGFMARNSSRIRKGNQASLEIPRATCGTSQHLRMHYDVVRDVFLETGVAIPNPAYDPSAVFDKNDPGNTKMQVCRKCSML